MSEEGQKEILVKKILYDDLFENLAGWGVIKSQVVKTIKGRRKKSFWLSSIGEINLSII